jgi:hypothetical protein
MTGGATATRSVAAVNTLTGLALLARPEQVVEAVTEGHGVPAKHVVRILGARLALQGILLALLPRHRIVTACAAVDLTHAASMYALCRARPRYRRAALASALAATASGALTAAAARGLQ